MSDSLTWLKKVISHLFPPTKTETFPSAYICQRSLGSGGNAKVWLVTRRADNAQLALKQLTSIDNKEKGLRFEDEIDTLCKCKDIEGVMQIEDFSKAAYWYTMPIAERIDSHITTLEEKVDCILQISKVLIEVHKRGFAHRDIKPANILWMNGRFVLGDFGLVDIPDNPHGQTKDNNRVGAVRTLAPEMSGRKAKSADGKKADVYSLAKTMWILLTNDTKGFEGVYDYNDETIALRKFPHLRNEHLVELEELLHDSTQHNPTSRPTMQNFYERICLWKKTKDDLQLMSISNWEFLQKRMFSNNTPTSVSWTNVEDIVCILDLVCSMPATAYLFFPDRGDMDLDHVMPSSENGCLDIIAGPEMIRVKPKKLEFCRFKFASWNYFLLELQEQERVLADEEGTEYDEIVVEDYPGHYVSAASSQYGVYDYDSGKTLPNGSKEIIRFLKGKFLIVLKFGDINYIAESSDGRHSNCTSEQFYNYIQELEQIDEKYIKGDINAETRKQQLKDIVAKFPFKPLRFWEIDKQDGNAKVVKKPVGKGWSKNHIGELDFFSLLSKCRGSNASCFADYSFEIFFGGGSEMIARAVSRQGFYLTCKGIFTLVSHESDKIFKVHDIDKAKELYIELSKGLKDWCKEDCAPYLRVHINKLTTPEHLFSRKEIEHLMRNADDRLNNTLVINVDGYAHLIQDTSHAIFFPLRNETWCAGNNYVGKYSQLGDLDSAYHYCLSKWLEYLKSGEEQLMEDFDNCNLSNRQLEEQIHLYMNGNATN